MATKPTEESKNTSEVFSGLLMYCKLHEPDTYKGQSRWTVDLLLDAEELKRAKDMKLRIKKVGKNGKAAYADMFTGYDGSFLRLTKNTMTRAGATMEPPKLLDEQGRAVNPKQYAIGNGTAAKVKVFVQREISKEEFVEFGGYKPYLNAVRIKKLIPYTPGGFEADPDFIESNATPDAGTATAGFDWDKGDAPFDDDSGQTIMAAG
jgi:hypothetical protein